MADLQTMYPAGQSIIVQTTADISASEQTIPVTDGSVFPAGPNFATLGTDNGYEVIIYTAVDAANNQLTGCLRGQPGTPAKAWTTGAFVYHAWTALNANAMIANITNINAELESEEEKGHLPIGGTTGQILAKASATDYDSAWSDIPVQNSAAAFTIPSTAWTASTTYPDYAFEATISVPGVTANDLLSAYFDLVSEAEALETGVNSRGHTGTDTATYYAETQPPSNLTGMYVIFKGAS